MRKDSFTFQVVFDFRHEEQKALLKEFGSEKTFKDDLNLWEDDLRIIASEEVIASDRCLNNSVIYEVAGFNKVLHILATIEAVHFVFYEAKPPF